jgi:hypothetical protein
MDLDGFLGRAKVSGDLFVQEALNDEGEDLALAWRQRLRPQPQPKQLLFVRLGASAPCDALLDGIESLPIVERLGEELQRASVHRSDRHRDVAAPVMGTIGNSSPSSVKFACSW